MNPHILKLISEGEKQKRLTRDNDMWMMGIYISGAVRSAVEPCLFGKKSKYEYFKKPLLQEHEEANRPPTEEEIQQQREAFVAQLEMMKANFERNQKAKEKEAKIEAEKAAAKL